MGMTGRLLRLEGSKHDKRVKRIHLTDEGERYRHEVATPVRKAELQAMATLELDERRAMITYVDKFMNALVRCRRSHKCNRR